MSRPTTILALLQTVVIVVGFFVLGIVLKISGYGSPHELGVRWNPLAVFLREHGLWLLVLPIAWVLFAIKAERMDSGFFSYRLACLIGLCVACLTIVAFLYAAVFPYSRPFFIGL